MKLVNFGDAKYHSNLGYQTVLTLSPQAALTQTPFHSCRAVLDHCWTRNPIHTPILTKRHLELVVHESNRNPLLRQNPRSSQISGAEYRQVPS